MSGAQSPSLVEAASRDGIENEKCVVSQYRTTIEQKNSFVDLLSSCSRNEVPLEWVIDIADETSGWFYGTAYHYDDTNNMLHVMVPDKHNPSFDGHVVLDHRTVHLIECVDGKSEALFNKIVRESVTKVRWDVEWFEEDEAQDSEGLEINAGVKGHWILSSARYYIRMINQLLVEDSEIVEGAKGFVMLAADTNIRLLRCQRNKGQEDFGRLIQEGIVQSTKEAVDSATKSSSSPDQKDEQARPDQDDTSGSSESIVNFRKLSEWAKALRACMEDLLDERDNNAAKLLEIARLFKGFALNGDLDAGMSLIEKMDEVISSKDSNGQGSHDHVNMDTVADDAWHLSTRIEKSLVKASKSAAVSDAAVQEIESLKKSVKKLKSELDDREQEILALVQTNFDK